MAEFPITFGQQYGSLGYGCDPHPTLGIYGAKDGYLIVEAETRAEARERAFRVIGEQWAFDYERVEDLDPENRGWYSRGEIARILADDTIIIHEQTIAEAKEDLAARRFAGRFFMASTPGSTQRRTDMATNHTGTKYVAINDRYDTDEDTGLVVEVKIDRVEHQQLGAWLARMNDRDQATVISGLANTLFDNSGHSGEVQIGYMVMELRKCPNQGQIDHLIELLYAMWKDQ